jgi:ubiquinone/menaquinone biosynthesis C-methylase UbiE
MENQRTLDNWNANLYDQNHSFVSKYGHNLIELLAPKQGENILDLGCGTGDLANQLYSFGVNVIGVDKSANMVQQAQSKYPNIKFIVDDATDLEYENEFDAIFSNATLHWVHPPKQALHRVYHALKHGGRFVAEFGGKGNVQLITDEIMNQFKNLGIEYNIKQFPWYFPSIGEYSTLMEQRGFRVVLAQHFDRPTPLDGDNGLRNWMNMFGSTMFAGMTNEIKEQVITSAETNLKETLFHNGQWIADYKRIRVIGMKE